MRKTASSILIGLACTSILSLSTGVQAVRADVQEGIKQTEVMSDNLQDFTFTEGPLFGLYHVTYARGNNLFNGYVTEKTTKLSFRANLMVTGYHY